MEWLCSMCVCVHVCACVGCVCSMGTNCSHIYTESINEIGIERETLTAIINAKHFV